MLKQVGVGRMKRQKIENGPMGVEEAATAAITKTSLESFPEGSVIHSYVILVAFCKGSVIHSYVILVAFCKRR